MKTRILPYTNNGLFAENDQTILLYIKFGVPSHSLCLTLSQTRNFRLFQTEGFCRQQF